jgi:hypothetical protein
MPNPASAPLLRLASLSFLALAAGCTAPQPPPRYFPQVAVVAPAYGPAPRESYLPTVALAPVGPVISVYVEPPLAEPPPLLVPVAPPPMLVEIPPPEPFPDAVWTGGYWAWHGGWIWSAGRWLAPPRPHYAWVQPYYEHRDDAVVFVGAHWAPPGTIFLPPPAGLQLTISAVIGTFGRGPAPEGPQGVFIPPPPGSHWGLIVPAPIGTPPAVVTSAPPIVRIGMRVENRNSNNVINRQITNNITNITNVSNVSNVSNIRNVTIVAPAGSTADGRAFQALVPASAHLAAARPALVQAEAPRPLSERAVPTFRAGEKFAALPAAQPVKVGAPIARTLMAPVARPPAAEPLFNTGASFERPHLNVPGTEPNPHAADAKNAAREAQQTRRDAIERNQRPEPPQQAALDARKTERSHAAPAAAAPHGESPAQNPDAAMQQRQHQVMEQQVREQQHSARQKAAQIREEAGDPPAQSRHAPLQPSADRAAVRRDSTPHHAEARQDHEHPAHEGRHDDTQRHE